MAFNSKIVFSHVSVSYPAASQPALKDFSICLTNKHIIGIIGNSRAGKTTLCHLLAGTLPKMVDGEVSGHYQINQWSPQQDWGVYNHQTGVVLQDASSQLTSFTETVADELAFNLINRGIQSQQIKKKVRRVAQLFGLTNQLTLSPAALSGGQKQRLAIASVIVTDPAILIMDDPTSQMDPRGRQIFFHWLQQTTALVFITSYEVDALAEVADELWLMDKGQLVDHGTPFAVFNRFTSPRIKHPVCWQLAKKMGWVLPTDGQSYPVNYQQLEEAFHAAQDS